MSAAPPSHGLPAATWCSGVHPFTSAASLSARHSRSTLAESKSASEAAMCSGVMTSASL